MVLQRLERLAQRVAQRRAAAGAALRLERGFDLRIEALERVAARCVVVDHRVPVLVPQRPTGDEPGFGVAFLDAVRDPAEHRVTAHQRFEVERVVVATADARVVLDAQALLVREAQAHLRVLAAGERQRGIEAARELEHSARHRQVARAERRAVVAHTGLHTRLREERRRRLDVPPERVGEVLLQELERAEHRTRCRGPAMGFEVPARAVGERHRVVVEEQHDVAANVLEPVVARSGRPGGVLAHERARERPRGRRH